MRQSISPSDFAFGASLALLLLVVLGGRALVGGSVVVGVVYTLQILPACRAFRGGSRSGRRRRGVRRAVPGRPAHRCGGAHAAVQRAVPSASSRRGRRPRRHNRSRPVAEPLLDVRGITVRFGGVTALSARRPAGGAAASSPGSSGRTAPGRPRCSTSSPACRNPRRTGVARRRRHHRLAAAPAGPGRASPARSSASSCSVASPSTTTCSPRGRPRPRRRVRPRPAQGDGIASRRCSSSSTWSA